jgi:hypothetical protein
MPSNPIYCPRFTDKFISILFGWKFVQNFEEKNLPIKFSSEIASVGTYIM